MNQQLQYKGNKILTNQKTIHVSIRFGNPRSSNCRNFGICKMEVFEGPIAEFQKRPEYALARINIHNNEIQIMFEKSTMILESQELYFGRKFFLVESDVILDKSIIKKLGIGKTKLKAGKYPVIETCSNYNVNFY